MSTTPTKFVSDLEPAAAGRFGSPLPLDSGLLLVGHGTRSREGSREFVELAELLGQLTSPTPVQPCFLELRRPDLSDGWRELVNRSVRHIRVVPVLLWAAGHALRDLPNEIAMLAAVNPAVSYDQANVLGFHPQIMERSDQRFREAIDGLTGFYPEGAAIISVGRGSTETQATEDMLRFAELRGISSKCARAEAGFVAMALPALGTMLDNIGQDPSIRDVVVQPHLLFDGDLRCTVCKIVRRAAWRYPSKRWIVTDLLGPHELVAQALLDRCIAEI